MSPVVLAGLVAPAIVAVATALVGIVFGTGWALGTLAVGAAGIVGYHLRNLDRLARWSSAELDVPVPEGHGAWRIAFSAVYRRVRLRSAHRRDLARTIERFTSAAEAVPDGMIVLDAGNRIRWANARAQRLLGLDLARDAGQPLGNLVRQPEFVHYLDAGDYTDAVVVASHREAGATLSIQIVPFGIDEKLLIGRDVTLLEAVARMRRDFIANVSHELKTPLTVVTGFVETLQELELEPRQRARYLELMQEQAKNMQRLVDDLLTLSALESEQNAPV
ncbi:MAG: phosphate regulon sensor protein PhoR, partial [Betaproteobacteria bacterium]